MKSLSCVQLSDPRDCSPPGSSVRTVGRHFTVWATTEVLSITYVPHIIPLVSADEENPSSTPVPATDSLFKKLQFPAHFGSWFQFLITAHSTKTHPPSIYTIADSRPGSPLPPHPGACTDTWRWTLRFHFSIEMAPYLPGVILPGAKAWP